MSPPGKLPLFVQLSLLTCVLAAASEELGDPPPPPEPTEPARGPRLARALAGLVSLPPSPRPGSGRERHIRRLRAQALAAELHLDVETVYQALSRGESEEQIRAGVGRANG